MNKEEYEMLKSIMTEIRGIRRCCERISDELTKSSFPDVRTIRELFEDIENDTECLNNLHVTAHIEG